ncbi:MAG: hypothetical protein Q9170_008066 [Blastenia crenularia]
MPISRIRGGTPVETPWCPSEQHSVNDPDLTALMDRVARRMAERRADDLQAARNEENALYRPPSYTESPDREESPFGGLPSPAASPPRGYTQLHGAHRTPSIPTIPMAGSHEHNLRPAGSEMAEQDGEAGRRSDLLNGPSIEPIALQPLLPALEAHQCGGPIYPSPSSSSPTTTRSSEKRSTSAATKVARNPQHARFVTPSSQRQSRNLLLRQRIPQRPAMTTRSKALPQAKFWELDDSGRRGRKIFVSTHESAISLNSRRRSTATSSFAGVKKQQGRQR